MELTERQKRESEFFDREYLEYFSKFNDKELIKNLFVNVDKKLKEYSDTYKYAYELIDPVEGKIVLDLGCGSGKSSVILAKKGAQVNAIDISKISIDYARKRAQVNHVEDKIVFEIGSVEKLKFDSNSFDLVFGIGLLHHVNIQLVAHEIFRVLKNNGQGVFLEPIVFSNTLDKIRHLPLVKYFVPDEGAEVLITEDEHQINIQEYSILDKTFNTCDYKSFRLLSRLDRIFCGYPVDENNIIVRFLNYLDRFLLNNFTFLRKFGGWAVISVRK